MKIRIVICIIAALFVFSSASVWEGAAAAASYESFPGSGFYVATNSFPRNTVVDITNLENGRRTQAVVVSRLEAPGLLAVMSRETASTIGLANQSVGRVSMIQSTGPIAFPRFTGEHVSDISWHDDDGWTVVDFTDFHTLTEAPAVNIDNINPVIADEKANSPEPVFVAERADVSEPAAAATTPPPHPGWSEDFDFRLMPAEERPPVSGLTINPDDIIPGISRDIAARNNEINNLDAETAEIAEPIKDTVLDVDYITQIFQQIPVPVYVPAEVVHFPLFQRHLTSRLERGNYVQIGAFSREEQIEIVISRIHENYPVAIYNAGTTANPMYRILLGPLNLGESGAMLQRFRSIGYTDAFMRHIR